MLDLYRYQYYLYYTTLLVTILSQFFRFFFLCIITGIIFLDILNPSLDRKVTFSPCKKLSKTSPRPARGNAWPRIISFPLDNLINFFKKHTQGSKEKVTRPKEKNP